VRGPAALVQAVGGSGGGWQVARLPNNSFNIFFYILKNLKNYLTYNQSNLSNVTFPLNQQYQ
jgi:hypothetical protein